jgi:NAD(P)-dependent dehydrogenase (short-subunit alcohol dehydrogenase family)
MKVFLTGASSGIGEALARDYARRRHAFGRPLADHALHRIKLLSHL